jgi:hypothetical protein
MATPNDNNSPNSNEYLEMANHAKELVEKAELQMNIYKRQNLDLKKELISMYGCIRVLDHLIDIGDCPAEVVLLSETLRGYLSSYIENNIL